MKILSLIIALSVLSIASTLSQAGGYIGADYTFINTDITDHTGINLKAGYAFNDYLSVEAKTLVTSLDEDYYGANVEIDYMHSVMLKLGVPVTDSTKVYGMIGQSRGEFTASYMGYSESVSDSSSSYGVGVSYDAREAYTLTAEYTRPFDDIDTFSVGVSLNF